MKINKWLMHLTNTRPYICFVVNTLILYLVKPRFIHLIAAKHVIKYLKGIIELVLYYGRYHDYILYGYMDSYWVGSVANRKSTLGGCYYLESTMISWFSKKQSSVDLRTTEAKYIASCSVSWEVIWLRKTDVKTI